VERHHRLTSVYSEDYNYIFVYGIELDWVLYSDYDALVEAFVKREIDLAWNAPLAYVKIKRRLDRRGLADGGDAGARQLANHIVQSGL